MTWKDRSLRVEFRNHIPSLQNHLSHVFPILNLDEGGGVDMIQDSVRVHFP